MPTSQVKSLPGFRRFKLAPVLEQNLRAAGYREPRPVQLETIPATLSGRDILGLAQTGTGKTAAFALPILQNILTRPNPRGPRALVVAPTRELAIQIDGEFRKLAASTRIRTVVIYGGVSERNQIQKLRRRPDVIVACPGRLLDLFRRGFVDFDRIDTFVLDEADHLFDMGFLPDIRRIERELPKDRQNLLFGATMPREIRQLADQMLRRPFVAELAHTTPAHTIDHALYPVREARKLDMLRHFLGENGFVSAIVFARTKHRAKRLALKLERAGHRATDLQGNMSQGQRDRAMQGFRDGQFDVLVATDIAARGIDVEQVSHVINFDVPNTPEAYTHRIGRTGRSERSGQAFTFVTEADNSIVRAIEHMIGKPIRIGNVPGFEETFTIGRHGRSSGSRGGKQAAQGRPASVAHRQARGGGGGGPKRGRGRRRRTGASGSSSSATPNRRGRARRSA